MLKVLKTSLFFVGIGMLCYGLGLIYFPLAPIAGGLFLLYSSFVLAKP